MLHTASVLDGRILSFFLGQRVQCPSLTRRDTSHGGDTRSGRLRKI